MRNQKNIEINSTKSSKLLHDFLPATMLWILLLVIAQILLQSFGMNSSSSKYNLVVIAFFALPIILYFAHKQSKSYKLDLVGLTITSNRSLTTIPWERIETVSKVSKDEGSFMYEILDKNNKKYTFPLDNKIGRTEAFFDSVPQLTIVPTKTSFDSYSARWKNVNSKSYKYTGFADRLMDFSYGRPNSNSK
jgi:hypothetical protein